jgi:hypothetical protein
MGIPSRDDLLGKARTSGLPRERIQVPEFDCELLAQGMSGAQRDEWERSLLVIRRGSVQDRNLNNVRARLVVRCLIHDDGSRVFTDADAEMVGAWRVDVLNRIWTVCQRLCGVSDQDADELGRASAKAAGNDSPTNSPSA